MVEYNVGGQTITINEPGSTPKLLWAEVMQLPKENRKSYESERTGVEDEKDHSPIG